MAQRSKAKVVHLRNQGDIEGIHIPLRPFCAGGQEDAAAEALSSVTAYLGLPFAQPPVGPLRWKRPQTPAPSWEGLRRSAWREDPIQELILAEFLFRPRRDAPGDNGEAGKSSISEDCLYLNIWVPTSSTETIQAPLPVLVWIYGGAFISGSTAVPTNDGARLAKEANCIVVAITYRVNLFGWLGSRELAGRCPGEGTGNYGMWDVVAGLQWVQQNIASFNGDKDNVTLFGESAGSILIHYLLLSSQVPEGLFARAVLNSGTVFTKPPRSLPSAQATFDALLLKMGGTASMSDEQKTDLLCRCSAGDLFEAAATLPSPRPRTEYRVNETGGRPSMRTDLDPDLIKMEAQNLFGPVWDGVVISRDFYDDAREGLPNPLRNGRKGVMLSYNVDEGSMFAMALQSPAAVERFIGDYHPRLVDNLQQLYQPSLTDSRESAFAVASALAGDELFQAPIRAMMLSLANQKQVPAFGLVFAHTPSLQSLQSHLNPGAIDFGRLLGVGHTYELPFIFGNDGSDGRIFQRESYSSPSADRSSPHSGFTEEERELSLAYMRSYAAFAHGQAPWKALNDGTDPSVGDVADCHVRTIGRCTALGSQSESAKVESAIAIADQRLADHPSWTTPVGSVASTEQRQAFWIGQSFKNILISFYGDERIRWLG